MVPNDVDYVLSVVAMLGADYGLHWQRLPYHKQAYVAARLTELQNTSDGYAKVAFMIANELQQGLAT